MPSQEMMGGGNRTEALPFKPFPSGGKGLSDEFDVSRRGVAK
jgi:hypothetical protein